MVSPPPLDIAHVQRLLATHRLGRHIRHEMECGSTNDLAHEMLLGGAPSGLVVVAESQRAGRGRFQRTWTSAPGLNLLFSVVVRWPRREFDPHWLTLGAALAVRRAVATLYHLAAGIKWPNDVVCTLGDGIQKLAGVLTEARALSAEEEGAVVGIGLNVNQVWSASEQDPERPRISLAAALGRMVDREPLLAACLACLEERIDTLRQRGPAPLVHEARDHLVGVGKRVRIEIPSRHWEGTIQGIDDTCHLLLRTADGRVERLQMGEVLFASPRGGPR